MTLAEFVLARIAEDEAQARQAVEDNGFANGVWVVRGNRAVGFYIQDETRSGVGTDESQLTEGEAVHIARWDPARVLAECEAKRRIVGLHMDLGDAICGECWDDKPNSWPCATLRMLALPYAAHPDYDEEWRP